MVAKNVAVSNENLDFVSNEINFNAYQEYNETVKSIENRLSRLKEKPFSFTNYMKRGEFEITADFNKKVAKEKARQRKNWEEKNKHNKKMKLEKENELAEFKENKKLFFKNKIKKGFSTNLGSPKIKYSKYDADKEVFNLSISSSKYRKYSLNALVNVPISKAKKVKGELPKLDVFVIFENKGNSYAPQKVVFYNDKQSYIGVVTSNKATHINYGEKLAQTWKLEKERLDKLAKEKADKLAAAKSTSSNSYSSNSSSTSHIIRGPNFACNQKIHWRTFMNYLDKGNTTGIQLMVKREQCSVIPKGAVLPVDLIESGYVGYEEVATVRTPKGRTAYTHPNNVESR